MPKVKVNSVPRGMGRIIPNANGSYTLRYWVKGDGQHEETFSTRDLATDRQAEIWRAKRAGEETFTTRGRAEIMFNDACGAWIERSPDRGESTRINYRCTLKHLTGPLARARAKAGRPTRP